MGSATEDVLSLTWNNEVLGAVLEKEATCDGERIVISKGSSMRWGEILNEEESRTVFLSVMGATASAVLKSSWSGADKSSVLTLSYPDGGRLMMEAAVITYSEGSPHGVLVKYHAAFESTGKLTYTPPPSTLM